MLSDAIVNQIAGMNLSELKKKSPEYRLAQLDKDIDQYEECVRKLHAVVPAYENIKEFGVTNSICDTYKDMLWNEVEMDIEPFLNAPYAQLSYCIEGLGSVIRKIYTVLRNIIWRIKDFFMVEGFTASWFNACERQYKKVAKILEQTCEYQKDFDRIKYLGTVLTTFPYDIWMNRVDALIRICRSITNIISTCDKTHWESFKNVHRNDLNTLYIVIDKDRATINPSKEVRRESLQSLGWYPEYVNTPAGSKLRDLLKQGIMLKSKMNMFDRMILQSERNIADVLTGKKEPEVVRDEETIKSLRLFSQICNLQYTLIRGMGTHWEGIGNAYLRSCSTYKPGLFK